MVKTVLTILSIVFVAVQSLGYDKSQKSQNKCGMYRIKYNLKNVDNSFYKICDTSSVYQYDGEFSRDNNDRLYYIRRGYKNYYKFYGNGKVGYFGLQEKEDLSLNNMDPCYFLNAYYGMDKKGNYILKRFAKTKANGSYTVKCFLKFKKDTLEVIDEDLADRGYKKNFVKKIIPEEWLVYRPDW